jgi:hypothetical protein
MLDANVLAQFKVSNNPALTGWNSTMSIIDILNQLQVSYGKPNMMTLYTNDTLFRSPMPASNLPEMLFYRIKQCQEIQRIGNLPYSDEQIIANPIRILLQANIFPLKEFDVWEAVTPKTYIMPSRRSSTGCMAAVSRQWHYAAHPARTDMPTRRFTTSWRQDWTMTLMTTQSQPSCRPLR